MISKAKALFFYMYRTQEQLSYHKVKVKWYHKFILLRVRRYSKAWDIPESISQFDWIQAKKEFRNLLAKIRNITFWTSVCSGAYMYRRHQSKIIDKELEERRKQGIPDVPPFKMFSNDNAFYEEYFQF